LKFVNQKKPPFPGAVAEVLSKELSSPLRVNKWAMLVSAGD